VTATRIRQHASAYVSIRKHTPAYTSIQRTGVCNCHVRPVYFSSFFFFVGTGASCFGGGVCVAATFAAVHVSSCYYMCVLILLCGAGGCSGCYSRRYIFFFKPMQDIFFFGCSDLTLAAICVSACSCLCVRYICVRIPLCMCRIRCCACC
jgi:hypothetical protein